MSWLFAKTTSPVMLSSAEQAGESEPFTSGKALPETAVRVGHGRFCSECA